MAMNDRGLATEVNFILKLIKLNNQTSYLYCVLGHKHNEEEKSKNKWKQIWLRPTIQALDTSTSYCRSINLLNKYFIH